MFSSSVNWDPIQTASPLDSNPIANAIPPPNNNNIPQGNFAAIHQFCSIGNHSFVTGGSLVRKDVPPYVKAAREPLSYVGINSVGLRRRGFTSEKIKEIQNIYRILYQKHYNNSQASEIIEAEMEATPERDEILQFIKNSHRGIMKGYFKSN